ncbi:MAG: exodeoxyribonuclease VII small subunit [Syntrophomonadaceae bacterium]|nr:exodeoxyribonuclease VII small subunit [Syntrophomonadaceae bacterium]
MENINFELALKRLEDIVSLIEKGQLDLDESIKLFEEGMKLSVFCQTELEKADNKIKLLLADEETGELKIISQD